MLFGVNMLIFVVKVYLSVWIVGKCVIIMYWLDYVNCIIMWCVLMLVCGVVGGCVVCIWVCNLFVWYY